MEVVGPLPTSTTLPGLTGSGETGRLYRKAFHQAVSFKAVHKPVGQFLLVTILL